MTVRAVYRCAKSALYNTKCMLESRMCKKCSIQHKMYASYVHTFVLKIVLLYISTLVLNMAVFVHS